jgi:UDP-2-acetamido-3-amino-2,3-dideoxy-glucuronate N-acetyltransferase
MSSQVYIHPTAAVAASAQIGAGTKIWMNAQVREDVCIGRECVIGKDAYVDFQVTIGDRCKIQNGALVYHAADLAEGVFIGPGAVLTNDRVPRALTVDGRLADTGDWHSGHTRLERGASIGAGAILLTDITIGEYAMVGAGAVVTRNVPPHALVVGNPARRIGFVCRCGQRLVQHAELWKCEQDGLTYKASPFGGLVAWPVTLEFRAENARTSNESEPMNRRPSPGEEDSAARPAGIPL